MINCTLPCYDSPCISNFPPVSYTASVNLGKTKSTGCDICDPLCFKLFNCYHDIESYGVRFHSHIYLPKYF